jgi:hypothetical protein
MDNPSPPVRIANGRLSFDHPDPGLAHILTMHAMGTTSPGFLGGMIRQLLLLSRDLSEADLNYAMATIKGIKPRDHVESMLAQQMVAVQMAMMKAAARAVHNETVEGRQAAMHDLNRCARTFASQVDALKRYRSNGEQTVKVQHVVVNEGGQAIVGNVQHGGGGDGKKSSGQCHGPNMASQDGTKMLSNVEAHRTPLSGAGGTGQEGVPVPRREGGSPDGEA